MKSMATAMARVMLLARNKQRSWKTGNVRSWNGHFCFKGVMRREELDAVHWYAALLDHLCGIGNLQFRKMGC